MFLYDIDVRISHISTSSNKIRVSVTYLITITLISNRKIHIQWDVWFLHIWDLHIMSQWGGFRIKTVICVFIYFFAGFFSSWNLCFYYINFFFLDEVSNFRDRILTNQKQEFLVQNCQWNCMHQYFLNWNITLRLLRRFNLT